MVRFYFRTNTAFCRASRARPVGNLRTPSRPPSSHRYRPHHDLWQVGWPALTTRAWPPLHSKGKLSGLRVRAGSGYRDQSRTRKSAWDANELPLAILAIAVTNTEGPHCLAPERRRRRLRRKFATVGQGGTRRHEYPHHRHRENSFAHRSPPTEPCAPQLPGSSRWFQLMADQTYALSDAQPQLRRPCPLD